MALSAAVRQYRGKVEMALREHRQMDASDFLNFFDELGHLQWNLAEVAGKLDREAKASAANDRD